MKKTKSFLQKIIAVFFIFIFLFISMIPKVDASLLEDKYKDYTINNNIMIITENGKQTVYFIFTGSDGKKHKWPCEQVPSTSDASGKTYTISLKVRNPDMYVETGFSDEDTMDEYNKALEAWKKANGNKGQIEWKSENADNVDSVQNNSNATSAGSTGELATAATDAKENDSGNSTEDDDEIKGFGGFMAEGGGILLSPFIAFVNFFVDTAASALQSFMMDDAEAVMTKTIDNYAKTTSTNADVVINKTYSLTKIGLFYPNFTYSCEEIFANKVPMLDINFLNPSITDLKGNIDESNIAYVLQDVIKAWYRVLRLIAIVGLLSVLIYIGIRIMIDSNTANKAKYKEKLIDWVVALVIVFTMHYIMSFTITMAQELTNLFSGTNNETRNIIVSYHGTDFFKTNLIGLARFKVQNDNLVSKLAYEIVYIALLVYTIKFTIVYLKRVMNMAFLTLISPLVALMYPIQNGKAQAFGMWFKEYMFNALLQPMHYLLYTVLVSSSISLAANNPLYAIIALFFMTQAEKFLKTIFGFDKAGGGMVGGMGAFASGALASTLISNIAKGGGLLGIGKGNGDANSGGSSNQKPGRVIKPAGADVFAQGSAGSEDDGNPVDVPFIPQGNPNGGTEAPIETPIQENNDTGSFARQAQMNALGEELDGYTNEDIYMSPELQAKQEEYNRLYAEQQAANQPQYTPPVNLGEANQLQYTPPVNLGAVMQSSMGQVTPPKKKDVAKRAIKRIATRENAVRALKGAGRFYAKTGMALTAAAVQMGASITDGKFSPIESAITGFAAAKATDRGMTKLGQAGRNVIDNYNNIAYGSDQAAYMSYVNSWRKDSNVTRQFNDKYGDNAQEYKNLTQDVLLSMGYTDFDDQKKAISYMESVQDERQTQWENAQKADIKRNNANYTDAQVEQEFNRRKSAQAEQIRQSLGKNGKGLSDDQAIKNAIQHQALKEAGDVMAFREKAVNKDALTNPQNRSAFVEQQARAIVNKNGGSVDDARAMANARSQVNGAFRMVDRFDSVNNM